MVTNRNGNRAPGTTGESVRPANSLIAGTVISGRTMMIAAANITMVPTFMKVDR